MNSIKTMRLSLKLGLAAPLALATLAMAPKAHADSILLAQSTLVVGSSATTDTFVAPTAGIVTWNLNPMNGWAQPAPNVNSLSALSFSATSADQVLASWGGDASQGGSFVVGPGTYFANIMATASGQGLDMGIYSLMMTFAPVPLPASGWMLLTGMFVLAGVLRAIRPFESMGTAEA